MRCLRRLVPVRGDDGKQPTQVRVGCTDLAGHKHDLIVVEDESGLVLVFPPAAWAVLVPGQIAQLRAALDASAMNNDKEQHD